MKIAGISMTYNDGYKLKEWFEHYEEYKDYLDYYVIVDNGSDKSYVESVKEKFINAKIICRSSNGGCTAAYNDGIEFVIRETDADIIVIIGNDVRLAENCISVLSSFLLSNSNYGLVTAPVLHINSMIVDNFGIRETYFGAQWIDCGKTYSEIAGIEKETELFGGGFYMFNREFYNRVGGQDTNLFMYCDELDTAYRARKAGYKIGITSNTYVWHWHIDQPGLVERKPGVRYLIARNRVYLAKKHFKKLKVFVYLLYYLISLPIKTIFSGGKISIRKAFLDAKYIFLGALNGLIGNMKMNKYTKV